MNSLVQGSLLDILKNHAKAYPTPVTINYFWGFGSLSGVMLMVQIITGVLLSMHYVATSGLAFESVEHIMRDVNSGWLLRYMHANGASMFFAVVYLHMARSLFYRTYKMNKLAWNTGVIIFILMMGTAFIGYVLPWGQMSYWGATVITNLVTAIPKAGIHIVQWVWGGFSVEEPTLKRFFSLHFLLPFVILGLVGLHLAVLHKKGSSNPLGIPSHNDFIYFHPYFTVKDLHGLVIFFIVYFAFIFYVPNYLGHPDNYVPANPLVTPLHIVPEWYFLPFYAILRACPDKVGGVISMFGAIVSLILLSASTTNSINKADYVLVTIQFVMFMNFLLLGWLGAHPAASPFVEVSKCAATSYFLLLIILGFYDWILEFFNRNTQYSLTK